MFAKGYQVAVVHVLVVSKIFDEEVSDPMASLDSVFGKTNDTISYNALRKHIYISNNDIHNMGVIEYDIMTLLQTNKYQVAGILGSHALVVDPQGVYIYAAVGDKYNQNLDYSDNAPINIQKITIIP